MKDFTRIAAIGLLLFLPSALVASPVVLHFDSLTSLDIVTTQLPGLSFSNTTVLTAGDSLNEFEFPPVSATNVVFDDGGPMWISFLTPTTFFSGYFTYAAPLTLEAFDAGSNLLGSATSLFASNLALSGDPGSSPNEILQLSFTGISSVRITGDSLGGSFTLDDLAYARPAAVPEAGSIYTLLCGVGGALAFRKKLFS